MDSRVRGNDGNRAGDYWVMQSEQTEQACKLDVAIKANLE
jgi:hypothetical protein